jgi:glycopeptide antibiotics resistance protein
MIRDPTTLRRVRFAARAAYVCVVLLATLNHLHLDPDPGRTAIRLERALHWATRGIDVVDAARNVALFAGFGVIFLVTTDGDRPWRTVGRITLEGLALSVSVEAVQLLSWTRTSSINDVTTNTLGALLGAGSIVIAVHLLRRARAVRTLAGVPMFAFAISYAGVVTAEAFSPLYRRESNPWVGGSVSNRLAHALMWVRPLDAGRMSLLDVVLFAPAGALAVVALAELGVPYGVACVVAALGGATMSVVVEVLHGIAGQPIEVSAIASHALGIALGAVATWCLVPPVAARARTTWRGRAMLVLYVLLLVAWAWRPFLPRTIVAEMRGQLTPRHLTPLGVLGSSEDLFGVMDLAEQFCLYLPLGLLLAVWPLRRRGAWSSLLPGIWLALALEVGQIFVRDRIFDVTDLLVQCAALAVGYVVATRAGYGGVGAGSEAGGAVEEGVEAGYGAGVSSGITAR